MVDYHKVVRGLSAYPSALLQLCFLYAFFNGRSGVVGASCVPCVCIAIAINDAATLGNVCFRAAPPLALLTVLFVSGAIPGEAPKRAKRASCPRSRIPSE